MDVKTSPQSASVLDATEKPRPPHIHYIIMNGVSEQTSVVALYIIYIILILFINIFFIVVILMSKAMRSSSRHLLIINVCVADLIMGLFVMPVLLNLGLQSEQTKDPSCSTLQSLRIFADYLLPSVATLSVLALNVDYVLRLSCSLYAEGCNRFILIATLFAAPWAYGFFLLIPLYKDNTLTRGGCNIHTNDATEMALLLLSFVPQAFLILIFNVVVSVLYLFNRETFGLDVRGDRIRAPVDICLVSFLTLVLYAPVFLISLLTTQNLGCTEHTECYALGDLYTVAIWAMLTKSWLMCFSWLTCRDTRACVLQVLGC